MNVWNLNKLGFQTYHFSCFGHTTFVRFSTLFIPKSPKSESCWSRLFNICSSKKVVYGQNDLAFCPKVGTSRIRISTLCEDVWNRDTKSVPILALSRFWMFRFRHSTVCRFWKYAFHFNCLLFQLFAFKGKIYLGSRAEKVIKFFDHFVFYFAK